MSDVEEPKKRTATKTAKKRAKLPPKGTAARALFAAGLWSHMTREEIEHIKKEIYGSRT